MKRSIVLALIRGGKQATGGNDFGLFEMAAVRPLTSSECKAAR